MIGLGIVVFLVLISIFADFLFDYNTVVIKQNTAIRLQTPARLTRLGTDEFGRDILARLVHGSRVSLSVGVVAVSISTTAGSVDLLGAIAGFYGGKIDNVMMRIMDIFLAVPAASSFHHDRIRTWTERLQLDVPPSRSLLCLATRESSGLPSLL